MILFCWWLRRVPIFARCRRRRRQAAIPTRKTTAACLSREHLCWLHSLALLLCFAWTRRHVSHEGRLCRTKKSKRAAAPKSYRYRQNRSVMIHPSNTAVPRPFAVSTDKTWRFPPLPSTLRPWKATHRLAPATLTVSNVITDRQRADGGNKRTDLALPCCDPLSSSSSWRCGRGVLALCLRVVCGK